MVPPTWPPSRSHTVAANALLPCSPAAGKPCNGITASPRKIGDYVNASLQPKSWVGLWIKRVLGPTRRGTGRRTDRTLGHAKHQDDAGRESTNVRNGSRSKTVIYDAA